jgi:hypothetical protein
MGCSMFGAPDLVFYFPTCFFIAVVETKFVKGDRRRKRYVKHQARKYAVAISVLVPTFTVFAFTYTEQGYKFVTSIGLDESRTPDIEEVLLTAGINTGFLGRLVTVSPVQVEI